MLSGAVLAGFNHVLNNADWAQQKLVPFAGRRARLQMAPWQIEFSISPSGLLEQIDMSGGKGFDVEMILPSGAWLAFLRGPNELMRSAFVTGSAEFAEALGFVFARIRWDSEEDLARLVGDIPAHRIKSFVSSLYSWQKQTLQRVAENMSEFLTEESSVLATSRQANRFVAEIDELRDDVARLEKRIQRLS